MSVAVAVSLLLHFLFLFCLLGSPKFAGQGAETGKALEIRLSAVVEKKRGDVERIAEIGIPNKRAKSSERKTPAVLSQAAPTTRENPRPDRETRSGDESKPWEPPEQAAPSANPPGDADGDVAVFFTRSRLSVLPMMLTSPALDDSLPVSGRMEHRRYVLRLFIDRDGQVVDVLGTSSLNGERILEQLIAAFKSVRFSPAQINGIAVNSQIAIEVDVADVLPGSSQVSD
jgi:hypothetical protein